jgi:hypothetical protein
VAVRTPYFWVLVAGTATSGLLATVVIFHQISLLGERGLSPAQAAATFLPMTATGIVATLVVGYLIDRFDHPRLLVAWARRKPAALCPHLRLFGASSTGGISGGGEVDGVGGVVSM